MRAQLDVGGLSRVLVRDVRRKFQAKGRAYAPHWHDPYPWIPGTVPEKMVFAELMGRRIEFVFQALGFPPKGTPGFTGTHLAVNLGAIRPDTLIPSIKAAVEIQGTYFHTVPEQEKHDQQKAMEYHAWGWHVYWIWDLDILANPRKSVDQCRELYGGPRLGLLLPKAKDGTESHPGATTADANAVAIANQKRARRQSLELRVRHKRGYRKTKPRVGVVSAQRNLAAPTPIIDPGLRIALPDQAKRTAAAPAPTHGTALFVVLLLYGAGTLAMALFGDDKLAAKMLTSFSAMFTGVLGLGSGYLLGQRAANGNGADPVGSPHE